MFKSHKTVWLALLLLLFIALLALTGIATGVSQINALTALQILLQDSLPQSWTGWIIPHWSHSQAVIVLELRAPRVVLAMLTGAGLAVAGAALQATTRNPLADPFLLGVSAGASMGAVLVISHTGMLLGLYSIPLFSFMGGLVSFLLLLALLTKSANQRPDRLILAGLAISFLLMAVTNILIFLGDQRSAQSVVFWMLGGLGRASWDLLKIPLVLGGVGILLLCLHARTLNTLMLGQETAIASGVAVNAVRIRVLFLCTLISSLLVSLTGTIGFVGLVTPHIVRFFVGGDNHLVLPLSALTGAAFVLLVDIIARQLLAPQELPIGIITGAIGGAYFCYLLLRR